MQPPSDRRKLTRRHRTSLVVLAAVGIAVLLWLFLLNQQKYPGLPALLPALQWASPTPNAVVLLLPSALPSDHSAPLATPTTDVLPTWLNAHATPAPPNEPGPTTTPTAYFAFLPGVLFQLPAPTPTPPLKTEPVHVPPTPSWPDG